MAPEVIKKQGHTEKADIWSFGIFCIELTTVNPPYIEDLDNQARVEFKILENEPPQIKGDKWSA